MTISLCMIVKNEEKYISRCLECAALFADEIIIVDTGSEDNTKDIVKKYTDKIYDFKWIDDFSAARNFSFSKAEMEYIMWLDADDIISDDDIKKILELKISLDPTMDAVLMKYALHADEYGHVSHGFYRERLVKRSRDFKWQGAVHEYLKIEGNVLQTDICITHASEKSISDRNLKILENLIKKNENITSREFYYYAKELCNNGRQDEAEEYYLKFFEQDNITESIYFPNVCMELGNYYIQKNQPEKAMRILIRSMESGIARPEILCCIGTVCKIRGEYQKAISWYELIFDILVPKLDLEMHSYELGGFIPCVELCYCCCQTGDYVKAVKYNEMAARYKPDDPIIKYNRSKFREAGISL